jgi:hypothetical protein
MRWVLISSIAFLALLVSACQGTVTSPDELAFAEGGMQAMAGGTQGVKVTGGGLLFAVGQNRPFSCNAHHDHISATDLGHGRARGQVEHQMNRGQGNWPDCTDTKVMVNKWHGVVDGLLAKQVGDVTYVNVCGVITHDKAGTGREGERFGIAIEDSPAGDRQIKRPWIDCADPENPYIGPAFWYAMYEGDFRVDMK